MTLTGDILDWSLTRPSWQRDALRRIAMNSVLTGGDYDELANICLGTSAAEPLSAEHLPAAGSPGSKLALRTDPRPPQR